MSTPPPKRARITGPHSAPTSTTSSPAPSPASSTPVVIAPVSATSPTTRGPTATGQIPLSIDTQLAYILSRYTAHEQAIEAAFYYWKDQGITCFPAFPLSRFLLSCSQRTDLDPLDLSDAPQLPPLSDPKLWKSFVTNSRSQCQDQGPSIRSAATESGIQLRDEWHVQELVGDKAFNLLIVELLLEYSLHH